MAKKYASKTQAQGPIKFSSFDKIKKDDIMLLRYYVKVSDKKDRGPTGMPCITVEDLDKKIQLDVNGSAIIESCLSADQFKEEKKETRTQIAERLIHAKGVPFTVCFEKTDGTERILRGRLIAPEPLMGRSQVEDLDKTDADRFRLIDHRTIKYLIVENVKWTVK